MTLTIREALTLPELSEVQVEAGANGLDNVIQMVSVMEVPDIGAFVEAGELLLTTTYPICNSPTTLQQLVPMLAELKLAGLAIKPERYIDKIPASMIEQADALNFPLLRLPKEPSFTKILNAISSEILHNQAKLLRYSEKVHRTLTDLILSGHGNNSLIQTLSKLINLPAAFISHDLEILITSDVAGKWDDCFFGILSKLSPREFQSVKKTAIHYPVQTENGLSSIFVHPIKAGKDIFGYICIGEQAESLQPIHIAAVNQVAVALALNIEKQRAVKEMERRFLYEFIRDLLEGRIKSFEELKLRGQAYGWKVQLPQILLVIKAVNPAQQKTTPDSLHNKLYLQQKIENAIQHDQITHDNSKLIAHMGDMTILLFRPTAHKEETAKQEACELAQRLLKQITTGNESEQYIVNIGISRLCQDAMHFPGAFREASESLKISAEINPNNSVVHYEDLGIYRLLSCIHDTDELERFCKDKIGSILDYDNRNGTTLIATLQAVIQSDGNLKRTAELLFIHYNTLRYRLQRIEEIGAFKIDSWQSMTEISLALKGHQVLQSRKNEP